MGILDCKNIIIISSVEEMKRILENQAQVKLFKSIISAMEVMEDTDGALVYESAATKLWVENENHQSHWILKVDRDLTIYK